MSKCVRCEKREAYIQTGEAWICGDCYNKEMSVELGVKAESHPKAIVIHDSEGEPHMFGLKKRLDPEGIFMEAEELDRDGYQFELKGDLHGDQGELLLRLFGKIEQGMAERFIQDGHLADNRLAGRIGYDQEREGLPLIIVDGKAYSWEAIGRMLESYEGFQLKLEMIDPTDEVRWDEDGET